MTSFNEPIKFWRTTDEYGFFSNFSAHSVVTPFNQVYPTTEHYYQAHKAVSHEDHESIRLAETPKLAKQIAQTIKMRPDWDAIKYDIMIQALHMKVDQHPKIKLALLASGNRTIIEDSPYDYIWGCGADGTGQNLLGKAWMQVRENILTGKESVLMWGSLY